MADRPANLLGLAVLGVLAQRPMHRYEIATTIREQGKDREMAVAWGSLYTVVGSLERRGLVESTGTERSGGRPERTTYRITASGRREMADWTRELLGSPEPEHGRFAAGLSMLGALSPDEAVSLLHDRLGRLDALVRARREALDGWAMQVPRLFLVEEEYGVAMLRAEAQWLRDLLGEFDAGAFPGVDGWRAHHDAKDGGDDPDPS